MFWSGRFFRRCTHFPATPRTNQSRETRVATRWNLRIVPLILVALIQCYSVTRHIIYRRFDQIFGRSFPRTPLCSVQGYLAHQKSRPPRTLCLGPYGDPRGRAVSYERGTPVRQEALNVCRARAASLRHVLKKRMRNPVTCLRSTSGLVPHKWRGSFLGVAGNLIGKLIYFNTCATEFTTQNDLDK